MYPSWSYATIVIYSLFFNLIYKLLFLFRNPFFRFPIFHDLIILWYTTVENNLISRECVQNLWPIYSAVLYKIIKIFYPPFERWWCTYVHNTFNLKVFFFQMSCLCCCLTCFFWFFNIPNLQVKYKWGCYSGLLFT